MLSVAQARPSERAEFIQKTYLHLAGAVAAFIGVETFLFGSGVAESLARFVISGGRLTWLMILGGFVVLGWLARGLASKADNTNLQYAGLALYVVGEAVIFSPMIFIATTMGNGVLEAATLLTLTLFGGLTAIAFTTRKDFSFLGGILKIGGFVALGLIICGSIFGFNLGIFFSAAMVLFAAGAILYSTSNVMHHFSTRHYVAASLELFASVALLFWYILQILMSSRR